MRRAFVLALLVGLVATGAAVVPRETPGADPNAAWLPTCPPTAGSYVPGDGSPARPVISRVQSRDVKLGAGFDCWYYPSPSGGPYVSIYVEWVTPRNPGRAFASCERKASPVLSITSEKQEAYAGVQGPAQSATFMPTARALLTKVEQKFAKRCGAPVAPNWKPGDPIPGTPEPQPKPPPGTKVALGIEWSMAKRFKPGADGLLNYHKTPKEIAPSSFRVDLVVRPKGGRQCRADDSIVWAGAPKPTRMPKSCRFVARFPKEGRFTLKATLKGKDGVTGTGAVEILVQDWLIFGLGDSNGSGEGAPDIPSPPPPELDAPVWQEVQCDRSGSSFEAQAALSIENRDPKTSVTFVHLACSGATIEKGMLGAYSGINERGRDLASQVDEMKRLAGMREIDAVLISIGVNDLRFGAMVEHCILYPVCQNQKFPSILKSPKTLDTVMSERIEKLPALYERLAGALRAPPKVLPDRNVYISEYFDSTRGSDEKFCDPLIKVDTQALKPFTDLIRDPFYRALAKAALSIPIEFDQAEARWAYERVLVKLNAQVRAAATKHGWRLITGVAELFRKHGYCSTGPGDPWIVGLFESFERQHDHNGTLHANPRGNVKTAGLAVKALRRELYPNGPGGPARPPK